MSNIKECFVSRFEDGYIVEADFKQLEIFVLAFLSQDPQLIKDLLSGVDLHELRAKELYNKDEVSKEERHIAKRLSFQLQYGAGSRGMSEKLGIPQLTCARFIDLYYKRYPKVKEWQDQNIKLVKASRLPTAKHSPEGEPIGIGILKTCTSKLYTFHESDGFDGVSFSPTVIKNYPVQGTAGDIVDLGLAKLYPAIANSLELQDKCVLINTVHDSFIFDTKAEVLDRLVHTVYNILTALPNDFETQFGVEFNLPLEVDIKVGRNWGELAPYLITGGKR